MSEEVKRISLNQTESDRKKFSLCLRRYLFSCIVVLVGAVVITLFLISQVKTKNVNSIGFDLTLVPTPSGPFESSIASNAPSNRTVSVQLSRKGALDQVKGYYKVYLDLPNKPGKFDSVIIYAKDASFPLNGSNLHPGTAAVIDTESWVKMEDASVSLNSASDQLKLSCSTLGISGVSVNLLGAHFLPLNFDVGPFQYGMGNFETYFVWSHLPRNGLMLPPAWKYS